MRELERSAARRSPHWAIVFVGWLLIGSTIFVGEAIAPPAFPTVTLEIVRIQEIDPIDGFLGDWDWFYWIGVQDGGWSWTFYEAPNGVDVTVDQSHAIGVQSSSLMFAITLCEDDFWTNDDVADISSGASGGYDDSASNCSPTGAPFAGSFVATWNLLTGTLSGDTVASDPQGWRTSGDFDGSTATDENDANLWFTITDDYSPPVASAGPDKQGFSGDTFSFDGTGSSASAGSSIEQYAWDFTGDLAPDLTGTIVSWTFNAKGTHTVTLTVMDSIGTTDTDTATVTIQNRAPTAAFAYSPMNPTVRDEITFADTSTDQDGTIASWLWDFGDGATSTLPNPTHQYATNGAKSVQLTVTDNDGDASSVTKTVAVANLDPVASFTVSPASPNTGDIVTFTDTSADGDGTIEGWAWDFGDGTTSDQRSPTHNFAEAGTYEVRLTVTDDDGGTDTATRNVTVSQALFAGQAGVALLLIVAVVAALVVGTIWVLRKRKLGPKEGQPGTPPSPPPPTPPGG